MTSIHMIELHRALIHMDYTVSHAIAMVRTHSPLKSTHTSIARLQGCCGLVSLRSRSLHVQFKVQMQVDLAVQVTLIHHWWKSGFVLDIL